MTGFPHNKHPATRPSDWWLLSIAALIAIMVLAARTRLTESGFDRRVETGHRHLPRAQSGAMDRGVRSLPRRFRNIVNSTPAMTSPNSQDIFWWEWSHRLLGARSALLIWFRFSVFLWRGA